MQGGVGLVCRCNADDAIEAQAKFDLPKREPRNATITALVTPTEKAAFMAFVAHVEGSASNLARDAILKAGYQWPN